MQRHRYFEGHTSQAIFVIMRSMFSAELATYFGNIREDDYEWVIGADVWDRITSNINDFDFSWSYTNTNEEPIYKIFDIEVTISTRELNTITLKKKNERRNEMPIERKSTIHYTSATAKSISAPAIKKVIFNNPATIVFWSDGSKTVVKCQDGEFYDPEKGLAMAISKKALGNKGNYCNEFKKWLSEEEEERTVELRLDTSELSKSLECLASKIFSNKEK